MRTNSSVGYAVVLALATTACGHDGLNHEGNASESTDGMQPTWEEFLASSTQTSKDGTQFFVIEGDLPVRDEAALRAIYDEMISDVSSKSLVKVFAGEDVVLDGEQLDFTYCVATSWPASSAGFLLREGFSETGAERRASAIEHMKNATRAWSAAANVYFRYVPSEDMNCAPDYNGVQINVMNLAGSGPGSIPACSTFPDGISCSGYERSLVMYYDIVSPADRLPLFIHEVGHTLGLLHEQYGSGDIDSNGVVDSANSSSHEGCSYTPNWRRLAGTTTYDVNSIMGYEPCNLTPGSTLSPLDGMGARELYGAPAAWYTSYGSLLWM